MNYTQFTIRKVPDRVRERAKLLAKKEKKSMNTVLLEVLERGLGLSGEQVEHHDLDRYAGTWKEDPAFDDALEAFEKIDEEMWR